MTARTKRTAAKKHGKYCRKNILEILECGNINSETNGMITFAKFLLDSIPDENLGILGDDLHEAFSKAFKQPKWPFN